MTQTRQTSVPRPMTRNMYAATSPARTMHSIPTPIRLTCLAAAFLLALLQAPSVAAQVLHDNGPLVTGAGNGSGGANTSAVQSGVNQTVTGIGASIAGETRVADNFTVPPSGWLVSGLRLFAFQPGAQPSSIGVNGATVRIWRGLPDQVGSVVVFDSANRPDLIPSVAFSNLFRVTGARTGDDRRPVARLELQGLALVLHGGSYWLDWELSGNRAAGPFVPPVTRAGQAGSGNAMQRRADAWWPVAGTGTGEELPFVILGGALPAQIFADGFES